jgi:hypothetical protein
MLLKFESICVADVLLFRDEKITKILCLTGILRYKQSSALFLLISHLTDGGSHATNRNSDVW